MGGLASVASLFARTPGLGLPPLPGNLGLPEKPSMAGTTTRGGRDDHGEFVGNSQRAKYDEERAKAENYNKAFADLLNNQAHLNGSERKQLYDAYAVGNNNATAKTPIKPLTDYSQTLSQLNPAQFKEQQQKLQQQQVDQQQSTPAPTPAPAPTSTPQPIANVKPDTVGATPQAPQVEQPAATPTTPSATGNVAGTTTTLNADEKNKGSGRRGRVATLLTGLGGAVERFGM